jgi:hypothetical protein
MGLRSAQRCIPLLWWRSKFGPNFGDELSPRIVGALGGRPVAYARRGRKLLAVGSILALAQPGDFVWGTGLPGQVDVARGVAFLAVRGPLTRAELVRQGHACPEVYGDPALLVGRLFDPPPMERPRVTVVPHHVDHAEARSSLQGHDVEIVDVFADAEDTLRRIRGASVVYSSSLHGLIAAEAFGVPAVWVEFSDRVIGGGFKFRDYYCASGRTPPAPLDWRRRVSYLARADAPEIRLPDLDALETTLQAMTSGWMT